MMQHDYNQAFAFIAALTQSDPNTTIIDVRMIHDTDKATAAISRRGTLPELWGTIVEWNNRGYGAFVNINEMDGNGRDIANVQRIRCQAIDLDGISAPIDYDNATRFNPSPSFAVQSSPGKFHVYWTIEHHTNRDQFYLLQRKLRTLFNGDPRVIDPSRVLRLPGTYHLKNPNAPHLITCWSLAGYGQPINSTVLEYALHTVQVADSELGERKELGDPKLQAPGLDWCIRAMQECDPNTLSRDEWVSFTSAFKQSAWNFAPEQQLLDLWRKWSEQYIMPDGSRVDERYLMKNWNSIRNTQIGWAWIEFRNPNLKAMRLFGEKQQEFQQTQQQVQPSAPPTNDAVPASLPPVQSPMAMPTGEFMTDQEQQVLFKGCVFIERMGEILTPDGRFMNATKFNGKFGGKNYIISSTGKTTNEPWAAALRSTLWTIPKADHIRFLPERPQGEFITDALGRIGVNTYKPANIISTPGDVTPFLRHIEAILPNPNDRQILFEYLAHNAKFPGYKIPWAPLIQSAEGAGKGAIKRIVTGMLGKPYVYTPKAQELIDSGSKFNSWMRSKLLILVDEIKVDERRDMIEILKPMISEAEIEIQSKGVDQDIEDNPANWFFFSNYKDAIPVNKNSRRFAVFYSAIQNAQDLANRGMDKAYFDWFYDQWMDVGGTAMVVDWLRNYPINRGTIAMRAPTTSSNVEAVRQSRGPVESLILEAVEDGLPGFRMGYVSSLAVLNRLKGTSVRVVSAKTLGTILEGLGYYPIGRSPRAYWEESKDHRAELFSVDRHARPEDFGSAQGYMGAIT